MIEGDWDWKYAPDIRARLSEPSTDAEDALFEEFLDALSDVIRDSRFASLQPEFD